LRSNENAPLFIPEHIPNQSSGQASLATMAQTNYGSLEITEARAVYTDASGVRWRLYDFAKSNNGAWRKTRVGSLTVTARVYVRQDGRERRCIAFSPRDDTLTPSFNHDSLAGAMVRERGRWVREAPDTNHPLARSRYH
jgi:hypothetical protein